jgi:hypothetical protein
MARTKAPPFEPDEIVVAWTSGATADHVIRRGERLRGDDPRVIALPGIFVRDGTPTSELPNVWQHVPEPAQDEPLVRVAPAIPDSEAAVAVASFTVAGRYIGKGSRLRRSDPVVKQHPELFRTAPLPIPGGGGASKAHDGD